ncbi:hypothetical protein CEE45_09910 [Candidatus Heimdallarchaeota archaeon B3_Heim]|nr:MAG: hypothetical protein CEE45_09910 [Candidatus Heimdallarchaeota archaeon B3_Heim]
MEVEYRKFQPNEGLEEIQAEIYVNAQKRIPDRDYPVPTVEEVVQQIKTRNETDAPDVNAIRYALTKDSKPLAYVQSHITNRYNATEVSFPHAMENCPTEVQDKLFQDVVDYVVDRDKDKGPDHQIIAGGIYRSKMKQEIAFLKSHNFVVNRKYLTYRYNTGSLELEGEEKFTVRKGDLTDETDLAALMEVGRLDETALEAFPKEEQLKRYYENIQRNPLKIILVFEGDLIVAAGAIRAEENQDPSVQLTFYRPGKESAWKLLMTKISKEAFDITQKHLSATYEADSGTEFEMVQELEKSGHIDFVSKSYRFNLPKN